jgi:hypothetical protein
VEQYALLDKIAGMNEHWCAIRDNWNQLMELWNEEKDGKAAPKLYKFMKSIGL